MPGKEQIKRLIKQKVQEIDSTAEVVLYGSRARNEEHEESDWDILILTHYPVSIEQEKKFRHHLYDLELEVEEAFSVFVYSKKDWYSRMRITPFFENVEAEGVWI